ncbi:hypothetical protein D3C87_1716460 [compost metagenome]
MFDHLKTPEDIDAFLAQQRVTLSEPEWRRMVGELAEEMARRGVTPIEQILQKIRVYKRATDQLELPAEFDPIGLVDDPKAQARGWQVLKGGREEGEH